MYNTDDWWAIQKVTGELHVTDDIRWTVNPTFFTLYGKDKLKFVHFFAQMTRDLRFIERMQNPEQGIPTQSEARILGKGIWG